MTGYRKLHPRGLPSIDDLPVPANVEPLGDRFRNDLTDAVCGSEFLYAGITYRSNRPKVLSQGPSRDRPDMANAERDEHPPKILLFRLLEFPKQLLCLC